jgi:hypothetical protein
MSQVTAIHNSPPHDDAVPQLLGHIRSLIELLELDAIERSRDRLAQRDVREA